MTTLTTDEQQGIEQFRASIEQARATMTGEQFALRVQTTRASLTNGTVARMRNAPRQEVIDAMFAVLDGDKPMAEQPAPVVTEVAADAPPPVSTGLEVGTRAIVVITASGNRALGYVKRLGGKFSPVGKAWVVTITAGNVDAARHLTREDGGYTGYQLLDKAAWVARRAANTQ